MYRYLLREHPKLQIQGSSQSADSAIPSQEDPVKGFRAINKDSTPKAKRTRVTFLLTPKHPRSERVDTEQREILPARMSEVLWVQLTSAGAAFASSCQQNNGHIP